jgi:hypothetical protein
MGESFCFPFLPSCHLLILSDFMIFVHLLGEKWHLVTVFYHFSDN